MKDTQAIQTAKGARRPAISVIMPVYNRATLVGEAIESILTQTFTDFELIIVDDASQDNSAEIIRSYAARDDRIRCLMLEQNTGNASARNRGLEVARGEFVACMDDDDISLPERLEKQVAFLRANPEIGVVGVEAMMTDHQLNPLQPYSRLGTSHARIAYDLLQIGDCIVGASMMMRRETLEACGGYDESLPSSPDIELVARLIPRTRLANLPEQLYLYRQHAGQKAPTLQKFQNWENLLDSLLSRIWGDAPLPSRKRFWQVYHRRKLTWLERRRARRDLTRCIDRMLAARWINLSDRAYLLTFLDQQMEHTMPRLWLKLLHWYRYRIKRRFKAQP